MVTSVPLHLILTTLFPFLIISDPSLFVTEKLFKVVIFAAVSLLLSLVSWTLLLRDRNQMYLFFFPYFSVISLTLPVLPVC